jgi:hypothetical protein
MRHMTTYQIGWKRADDRTTGTFRWTDHAPPDEETVDRVSRDLERAMQRGGVARLKYKVNKQPKVYLLNAAFLENATVEVFDYVTDENEEISESDPRAETLSDENHRRSHCNLPGRWNPIDRCVGRGIVRTYKFNIDDNWLEFGW